MRRPPARAARALAALIAMATLTLSAAGCGRRDLTAAEIYPKVCARCHGPDGKGAPQQVRLYPKADLTISELRGIPGRRAIYRRIAEGYGPMPGYAHKLSQAEIESLVDYCVKLQTPIPER